MPLFKDCTAVTCEFEFFLLVSWCLPQADPRPSCYNAMAEASHAASRTVDSAFVVHSPPCSLHRGPAHIIPLAEIGALRPASHPAHSYHICRMTAGFTVAAVWSDPQSFSSRNQPHFSTHSSRSHNRHWTELQPVRLGKQLQQRHQ